MIKLPEDLNDKSFGFIADKFQCSPLQAQFILVGCNYTITEVKRLNATAQPVSDNKSSLLTYLSECSEQVNRWPEWKKKGSDVTALIKEMDDFELGFVNGWTERHKQSVSDGWVKCSERMPPIGKRVLIPTSGLGEAIEAVRFESNKFNRFGIEVVADYWMPLPAAPGGQDA